jgi:hypothetical protein
MRPVEFVVDFVPRQIVMGCMALLEVKGYTLSATKSGDRRLLRSEDDGLTATLRRRQSGQAPSFLMSAARSLDSWERGPVRLLLVRRLLETSGPSLTEKMDWCRLGEVSALYDVLLVSLDAIVAVVAWVETEEPVSFRMGGETGW